MSARAGRSVSHMRDTSNVNSRDGPGAVTVLLLLLLLLLPGVAVAGDGDDGVGDDDASPEVVGTCSVCLVGVPAGLAVGVVPLKCSKNTMGSPFSATRTSVAQLGRGCVPAVEENNS
jgi:hypothetical protein